MIPQPASAFSASEPLPANDAVPRRRRPRVVAVAAPAEAIQGPPVWLQQDRLPLTADDAQFRAGAALSALDGILRREPHWAPLLRRRLALSAAASCIQLQGRREAETALRDAMLLTRPGDDVGPAGRIHLAWRMLATRRVEDFDAMRLMEIADLFGLRVDRRLGETMQGLVADTASSPVAAATRAAAMLVAERPEAEGLALWLADLVLARRLGWAHAVPLLSTQILAGSLRQGPDGRRPKPGETPEWAIGGAFALARAAADACERAADLARRAGRLLDAAPKLRAREADAIVGLLLEEDAITPTAEAVAVSAARHMSDRALRRLFDRLVSLGVVRELSGRSTFRIYGL